MLGAALDGATFFRRIVERELGAVSDNPLIFESGKGAERSVIAAGNFHGMPLAIAFDTLNIALTHVANMSTSAGMEDYNSFGVHAALKVRRVLDRVTDVVAIELLCAAEALAYQRPLRSGPGIERAFSEVRSVVSRRTCDRPPAPDIQAP